MLKEKGILEDRGPVTGESFCPERLDLGPKGGKDLLFSLGGLREELS